MAAGSVRSYSSYPVERRTRAEATRPPVSRHSWMIACTRLALSRSIWFCVTVLGWSWVSPEIRRPCRTLGTTLRGSGGGLASVRQLDEQPSPSAALPSSHCSPVSSTPLPHTGGAGGASPHSASWQVPPMTPAEPEPSPGGSSPPGGCGATTDGFGSCGVRTTVTAPLVSGLTGSDFATCPPGGGGGADGAPIGCDRIRPRPT